LVAQNGLCNIEYTIPLTEANAINFTYELDMKIESIELGSQVGTIVLLPGYFYAQALPGL
jgi:hypothetical protein